MRADLVGDHGRSSPSNRSNGAKRSNAVRVTSAASSTWASFETRTLAHTDRSNIQAGTSSQRYRIQYRKRNPRNDEDVYRHESIRMFSGTLGRPPRGRNFQPQYVSETGTMPTDNGLPLDVLERVQHFGREAIEPGKHPSIDLAEGQPLRRFAPQYIELVAKTRILACNAARDRNSPAIAHQINSQRSPERLPADSRGDVSRFWFPVGTGYLRLVILTWIAALTDLHHDKCACLTSIKGNPCERA